MQRKIIFAPGEYYHIYNRGVDKRTVFETIGDKDRFLKLLYVCNSDTPVVFKQIQGLPLEEIPVTKIVAIGAYCLMDNHFHLLIREQTEGGVSRFMEKISTGYTMYFNKKNDRSGSLFQGTFKAEHVGENDEYLKYLFAYIHLNPLKFYKKSWKESVKNKTDLAACKNFLLKYEYSSYNEYASKERQKISILSKEAFPDYFTDVPFEDFVGDWIEGSKHLNK